MGKLKTEVTFIERNGRTLSKRVIYYENGQIAETGIYSNAHNKWSWSVPVGVIKKYYENGQLECQLAYNEFGTREGESLYYDVSGKLIRKTFHSNDILIKDEDFREPVTSEVRQEKY